MAPQSTNNVKKIICLSPSRALSVRLSTSANSPTWNASRLISNAPASSTTPTRRLSASLGVEVHSLPEEPSLPDSVFVEDTAIVLDECAVLTRPGATSRQPETSPLPGHWLPTGNFFRSRLPVRLDGGDVLTVGKTIFVGLSSRSNQAAIDQLRRFIKPYGYTVKGIQVTGCLHLKSAVTQVATDTLLVNPAWVDKANFPGMKFIEIDPSEPYAANALLVGGSVLYQPAYPRTRERLEAAGNSSASWWMSPNWAKPRGLSPVALSFLNLDTLSGVIPSSE